MKSIISKYIVPIIQNEINTNGSEYYLEPFVGGANIIDKIQCKNKIGYDINKYLIALLKQAQIDISVFPKTITEEAEVTLEKINGEWVVTETADIEIPDFSEILA